MEAYSIDSNLCHGYCNVLERAIGISDDKLALISKTDKIVFSTVEENSVLTVKIVKRHCLVASVGRVVAWW